MRVYIASRYIIHKEINNEIYQYLCNNGIDAFLPASINIDAITISEMNQVADICYNEIMRSDVLVAISPYGQSVAAEIAFAISKNYFINQKKIDGKPITIIAYKKPERDEAMILPFFDYIVNSKEELACVLKKIENSESV